MKRLSKRIRASRENGARSCGPNTGEGKQRSSGNAFRHGLLSSSMVLPNESQEIFDKLLNQYLDKLDPADDVEHNHVEEMVAAVWRMRRLWAVQNRMLAKAVAERPEPDELDRIMEAVKKLAREPEFDVLGRYEARFRRAYQTARENLFLFFEYETVNNEADGPGNTDFSL